MRNPYVLSTLPHNLVPVHFSFGQHQEHGLWKSLATVNLCAVVSFVIDDNHYSNFKFSLGRRAESPEFTNFLLWIGPESVFLVQTKRKVGSGDEIANDCHTEPPQSDFKRNSSTKLPKLRILCKQY